MAHFRLPGNPLSGFEMGVLRWTGARSRIGAITIRRRDRRYGRWRDEDEGGGDHSSPGAVRLRCGARSFQTHRLERKAGAAFADGGAMGRSREMTVDRPATREDGSISKIPEPLVSRGDSSLSDCGK